MISGKYLGEVVRQVCLALIKMGALFGGKSSETFDSRDSFKTSFVSDIEAGYVLYVVGGETCNLHRMGCILLLQVVFVML